MAEPRYRGRIQMLVMDLAVEDILCLRLKDPSGFYPTVTCREVLYSQLSPAGKSSIPSFPQPTSDGPFSPFRRSRRTSWAYRSWRPCAGSTAWTPWTRTVSG